MLFSFLTGLLFGLGIGIIMTLIIRLAAGRKKVRNKGFSESTRHVEIKTNARKLDGQIEQYSSKKYRSD